MPQVNHRPSSDQIFICPDCQTTYGEGSEYCPEDGALLQPLERTLITRRGHIVAGRFHLEGVIGEGGMGTVYRAVQHPIERVVAVKMLHTELVKDKVYVSRFLNEAQAASVLLNPNTVTIFDYGQEPDGALYIAMEFLDGQPLYDRLLRGPLPSQHAMQIAAQVCRALAEAHRKGIVHRDLKPDNIMLTAADNHELLTKVVDFGIAKVLRPIGRSASLGPVTQAGVVMGTPLYMAPAQARGVKPDPASDLYSLGVVLFEMLAGEPPFNATNAIDLVVKHLHEPAPPVSSRLETLPVPLVRLVEALLEKPPENRPDSAEAVSLELQALLKGRITATEVLEYGLLEGIERADAEEVAQPKLPSDDFAFETVATLTDLSGVETHGLEQESYPAPLPPRVTPMPTGAGLYDASTIRDTHPQLEVDESSGDALGAPVAPGTLEAPRAPQPVVHEVGVSKQTKRTKRPILIGGVILVMVLIGGAAVGSLVSWPVPSPVEPMTLPTPPSVQEPSPREEREEREEESPEESAATFLVHLKSVPPGARVFQGSRFLCTTACSTELPTGQKILLSFRKEGYLVKSRRVEVSIDAEIVVTLRSSEPDASVPFLP